MMMATAKSKMEGPKVVSQAEWLAARKELLRQEKEYVFDGQNGKETLADLFDGKSQLIVYHFMFGPGWGEGCPSCSLLSDHIDGSVVHLAARDASLVVVSRAPLPQIEAFKKRMGWRFKWVSSYGNDFNRDYHVSFTEEELAKGEMYYNYVVQKFPSEEGPGTSVFYKNAVGSVFHTYSSYGRGLDMLIGAYNWLDLAPKGRDEDRLAYTMAWVRHRDKYSNAQFVDPAKTYSQPKSSDATCCSGENH